MGVGLSWPRWFICLRSSGSMLTMPRAEECYLRIISGESRGAAPAIVRALLRAAEVPFAACASLRNTFYNRGIFRAHPLGRPAISVGNLTAGGTGKTPVVQWLARRLLAGGYRPCILLRGYKKPGAALSDEAAMLAESVPGAAVIPNPQRVAGAASALAADPAIDVFILDDGMQHRRAGREAELALLNARSPWGFGHLHPRGLLREPLSSLERATAILLTHCCEVSPEELDRLQQTIRMHSSAPIFHADHHHSHLLHGEPAASLPLTRLHEQPFFAFAGIGNPASLQGQLRQYGERFAGFESFGDHHDYAGADLERLARHCQQTGAQLLLTTEKDWSKLRALPLPPAFPPLYRLGLTITFAEAEEDLLYKQLTGALPSPRAT